MEIEEIKKEYPNLLQQLSNPELISDWEKFQELSKKRAFYEKIIEKEKEIQEIGSKIEENRTILGAQEPELRVLAEEEISSLKERKKILEKELENLLQGKEDTQQNSKRESVIIEVRAGAGGDEAALFAGDLFRMYSRFAERQGWRQRVLDSHPTELRGFKLIIFELKNGNIWKSLQHEGGVHRIQRIPTTERSGRIHTSTASVAVLLKPRKAQMKIKPEDLRIDHYRASGPGGQYVNKRETAVRITHLSTGLVVTSQNERSQLQNKENAMVILEARLQELKERKELEKIHGKRKAQIGKAQRAEKIRTYNVPQNRVTDHRIQKSWHDVEGIMAGRLEPIIKALEGA